MSPEAARPELRLYWGLFVLAALSYALLLDGVQYTGEEAAYTLQAIEQWHAHSWLRPTLLGMPYGRPPLYSWLITLVSQLIGWPHVLAAARLVSAAATIGSGLLVAGLVRRISGDARRAAFTALLFLTLWEPLFYYGWLAYSDALFGFLVLGAMLAGWLAVREQRAGWLALALVLAAAGFLTKALTAYVFLGVLLLVALWQHRAWPLILRPAFLAAALLAAAPLLWFALAPTGAGMAQGMRADIAEKLGSVGIAGYLQHFTAYPVHVLWNLMPASGLVAWLAWRRAPAGALIAPDGASRRRAATQPRVQNTQSAPLSAEQTPRGALPSPNQHQWRDTRIALWSVALNVLPYWLAPQSSTRYLMPLYGLAAIGLATMLWPDARARRAFAYGAAGMILLKLLAAAWLFPTYTARVRPDIAAIARDVATRSAGQPLYVDNTAWVGTAVAATLDVLPDAQGRVREPLHRAPAGWTDALVLVEGSHADGTTPVRNYGDTALVCRGTACPRP